MELLAFYPLSGNENVTLETLMPRLVNAGYTGVQTALGEEMGKREGLLALLKKHDLSLFLDLHLNLNLDSAREGEGEAPETDIRSQLQAAAKVKPVKINVCLNSEALSSAENGPWKEWIKTAREVEKECGIPILFETCAHSFAASPASIRPYLAHFPDIHLNTDFAQWVKKTESWLEEEMETMELVFARSQHLQVRLANPQGLPIKDPRAPKWAETVDRFLALWDQVMNYHISRNADSFSFTPAFVPMSSSPESPEALELKRKVNRFWMELLKDRYQDAIV